MDQHSMHLWHCFPITISKIDLEGEGLICVPISLRICKSPDDGMKLKTASVLPLMTVHFGYKITTYFENQLNKQVFQTEIKL